MKKILTLITLLPAVASADTLVELEWDASAEHAIVADYILYGSTNVFDLTTNLHGCFLQAPVGTNLTATVDVPAGEPWAFAVTATAPGRLESEISNILELNRMASPGNLRKK